MGTPRSTGGFDATEQALYEEYGRGYERGYADGVSAAIVALDASGKILPTTSHAGACWRRAADYLRRWFSDVGSDHD